MDLAHGSVTWSYTMTADDVKLGLRAARRAGRDRWFHRRGVRIAVVIAIVLEVGYALVLPSRHVILSWQVVGGAVAFLAVLVLIYRTQVRTYRRLAALNGEIVASMDANGLRTTNERGTTNSYWSAYAGYVETSDAFVLLASEDKPLVVTILPKRGLADAEDVDRARTIIGEHVRAVSR